MATYYSIGRATVTASELNVREHPYKVSDRLGSLSKGATVEIIDTLNDNGDTWLHIYYAAKKELGWIAGMYDGVRYASATMYPESRVRARLTPKIIVSGEGSPGGNPGSGGGEVEPEKDKELIGKATGKSEFVKYLPTVFLAGLITYIALTGFKRD